MNTSTLIINGIPINKTELLGLINNNQKLLAIKRLREQAQIGLKASKDIIDILEINPNFQGNGNFMTSTKIETHDDRNHVNSPKSKKGSHFIESNSSKSKNVIIVVLALIIMILFYFLTIK